ncbi:hypothetical protein JHD47_05215 [Sulfurimonas sp. SAG-AH-194-L11]|nr:hypothetical protein [Sulfurimonas sp. SAG-AH-194-L11]MDF1877211.1 hypothetical protein [Sulfurimonas sp. SAG-AH-194-L11]
MKTLLFVFLTTILYANSYTDLNNYKKNHPSIKVEEKNGDFILRFKDINRFNFDEFEKEYNVEFKFCIADGICIFSPLFNGNISATLLQMRKREDLLSVEIYKKYNMQSY